MTALRIAASRYTNSLHGVLAQVPQSAQQRASSSLAGALGVASTLSRPVATVVAGTAEHAFIDGIHLAAVAGVVLAAAAAGVVWRYLPAEVSQRDALAQDAEWATVEKPNPEFDFEPQFDLEFDGT